MPSNQKLGLQTNVGVGADALPARLALIREAEDLGYTSLWIAEVSGPDAFVSLAALAVNTRKAELATGVVPIQIRTPGAMAMGFLTINELSGGRAIAGLGVSSPVIVERWHGASYRKPVTAMRECVTIMRQLFTEGRSKFQGEVYKSDFRLGMRITAPHPPKIYLAALNAPMLRLAGEVADGVLMNYSPPEAIAPMVNHIHEGARAAGRDPSAVDVGIYVRMCITEEEDQAVDSFRRELSSYAFVDTTTRCSRATDSRPSSTRYAGCGRKASATRLPEPSRKRHAARSRYSGTPNPAAISSRDSAPPVLRIQWSFRSDRLPPRRAIIPTQCARWPELERYLPL